MASFSRLDNSIWVTAIVLQFTVLTVLLLRGRWKKYPIFAFYIAFDGVQAAGVFALTHIHPTEHYDRLYWITTALEHLTEVGLILDTAARLFKLSYFRARGIRLALFIISTAAIAISSALSVFIRPPDTTGMDLLAARGTLCLYLFLFLTFTATSWLATKGRTYVPQHLRAIWLGIAISSFMFAARSIATVVTGWTVQSNAWDYGANLGTIGVLLYWSVSMWSPDTIEFSSPARRAASVIDSPIGRFF